MKTRRRVIAHLFRILIVAMLWLPLAGRAQDTIILGGWWFDSNAEKFLKNDGIVISGGVFTEVNAGLKSYIVLSGVSIIELHDDDYILPGMFDLHAHYNVQLLEKRREEFEVVPIVYLANGVTSTFTAGEYDADGMLELKKQIQRGDKIGPRIFNTGPYFGPARPGWSDDMTAEEIFKDVDEWAERGVAGFKAKRISRQHLKALIARAHLHGLTVTGHLDSGYNNTVNPLDAIIMGIDRVEHFLGGDALPPSRPAYASLVNVQTNSPEFREIVQLYLQRHVYFDATITAYGYFGARTEGYDYWTDEQSYFTPFVREHLQQKSPKKYIEQFDKIYWVNRKSIKAFYDSGGGELITLGTDHPSNGEFIAGFSAHRELEVLVRSGIPPAGAIKIATINGARALNVGEKLGSITVGKFADLFVVKGDPLQDITNTRKVHLVMKSGQVYYTNALLKSVEGKLGPTGVKDANAW